MSVAPTSLCKKTAVSVNASHAYGIPNISNTQFERVAEAGGVCVSEDISAEGGLCNQLEQAYRRLLYPNQERSAAVRLLQQQLSLRGGNSTAVH